MELDYFEFKLMVIEKVVLWKLKLHAESGNLCLPCLATHLDELRSAMIFFLRPMPPLAFSIEVRKDESRARVLY